MIDSCYVGDARDGLRAMIAAGIRAQTCVTSPPYWGLRDYGMPGQLGLEPTPAEYVASMVEVFRLVRDVLADDGTLWLNLGDSYAAKRLVGIPWRVAFALQDDGWYLRSDIIWHKPNPMPESVTDRPTKAHEYLFMLAKSERYYYDAAAIAEAGVGRERYFGSPAYSAGSGRNDAGPYNPDACDKRNKRTVWSVTSHPYADAHFAVMPRALVEPCVLAGSRVGDVVLDPFLGSGTVAQVAQDLGRQWIGCELNPEYVAMQRKRTAQTGMAFA